LRAPGSFWSGSAAAEEEAYLQKARELRKTPDAGSPAGQRKPPESLKPLTDLTADERYEGADGGLYGGGKNAPPAALVRLAETAVARIRPIDGKIGFVSLSMSNATMEFSTFKRLADAHPGKSPEVEIVDCAQGGQAMAEWVDPAGRPWQEAAARLARAGVTPAQVQAAWIKAANKSPAGSMAEHLRKLEDDTLPVIKNAAAAFPNLWMVWLGSRIWAGNAKGGLNPEPYAYETAFAVRHLIQRQLEDHFSGGGPVLLWGPYLWAEGTKGRKIDHLKWEPEDFAADGVHPSGRGREKAARQLLDFFTRDPLAKRWFAK
jgi:hypothetical protein